MEEEPALSLQLFRLITVNLVHDSISFMKKSSWPSEHAKGEIWVLVSSIFWRCQIVYCRSLPEQQLHIDYEPMHTRYVIPYCGNVR